ncbi:hypothetical protein QBC40DRAFT_322577 [Triangularia verruculosa]|uniref:Uncharacterized protein n=1 Tax=Triangularia verruculosa TaxID=2587418 RepID=A0AAN6XKD8_9PEZI|nr:hypothetical protein QBC40DRAFT_322577 [Triangularia verruculosa]
MLSTTTFLAGLLALSGMVFSAPAALDQTGGAIGIEGYTIVPIEFELPVKPDDPNGEKVILHGTIQEVIAKMEASYPGWNQSFLSTPVLAPSDDNLEQPSSFNCNIGFGEPVSNYRLDQGIVYLTHLSGTAKNGPGPGNCGRVSCSYGSAIYWCNEDSVEKELQWLQIADGAHQVVVKCQVQDDKGVWKTKGQANYNTHWNVVDRRDDC